MLASIALLTASQASLELPSVFADHMVMQRDTDAVVWGWADPGVTVKVSGSWNPAIRETTADSNGTWRVKLRTAPAGGPYTLVVEAGKRMEIQDVLMGEVWVCSGQSNMEMAVSSVTNGAKEIADSSYPKMRLFQVPHGRSATPQVRCGGKWNLCDPKTVPGFSAVGYFFGRELLRKVDVPIGLVQTTWGGTEVELWTSEEGLCRDRDFDQRIVRSKSAQKQAADLMEAWELQAAARDSGWGKWSLDTANDSKWATTTIPGKWGNTELASFDGAVWYRKSIMVPEDEARKPARLVLGYPDDLVQVWVNGKQLTGGRRVMGELNYQVPADTTWSGKNSITVRLVDTGGDGGFGGNANQFQVRFGSGAPIDLAGTWKMQRGPTLQQLSAPPVSVAPEYSTIYNSMIAPLAPFAVKGFIWYQGESNVGRGYQYRKSFPGMIRDWRRLWGRGDLPFYFVQIAPFTYGAGSAAAVLRESQLVTLSSDKNTGMAVISDLVANIRDIHPVDKQDVGRRLALWALDKDYGQRLASYSGPIYRRMKVDRNAIRLWFDHVDGGLVAKGGTLTEFEIAGSDGKFVPATATIDLDTIVVSSPSVANPAAVRYGWNNVPVPTLYNREGLPASSFRTDTWPVETQGVRW